MSCYAGNQVHSVFKWRRTYLKSHTLHVELRAEVVRWEEQHSLLQRKHIPLTHLDVDCTVVLPRCQLLLQLGAGLRDSVHALNNTVDLFTALRGIHTVQTQRPCQNRLSIVGVVPWGLRHRSGAAGLCNTIHVRLGTTALYHINSIPIFKLEMVHAGNLQQL